VTTTTVYDALYEGLRDGWLLLDDLGPDLAGLQVWVALTQPCQHPDPTSCAGVAVHEFAADGSAALWAPCDPDAQTPPSTGDVRGVRVLWGDGRAEQLSASRVAYLAPIAARHRPGP
jgi:hypothetical protein